MFLLFLFIILKQETRKKIISRESNCSNKTSVPTSRPNLKSRSSDGDLNFASRLIFSQNSAREKRIHTPDNENVYFADKNRNKINKNFLTAHKAFRFSSDQNPKLNINVKNYGFDDDKEKTSDEYGLSKEGIWNKPIFKKKKFLDLMKKSFFKDS